MMIKCNKRVYASEILAVDALIEARTRFALNTSTSVYQCENCENWHLTSRGNVHPSLASALENGTIKRNKEADYWERKLR